MYQPMNQVMFAGTDAPPPADKLDHIADSAVEVSSPLTATNYSADRGTTIWNDRPASAGKRWTLRIVVIATNHPNAGRDRTRAAVVQLDCSSGHWDDGHSGRRLADRVAHRASAGLCRSCTEGCEEPAGLGAGDLDARGYRRDVPAPIVTVRVPGPMVSSLRDGR